MIWKQNTTDLVSVRNIFITRISPCHYKRSQIWFNWLCLYFKLSIIYLFLHV